MNILFNNNNEFWNEKEIKEILKEPLTIKMKNKLKKIYLKLTRKN